MTKSHTDVSKNQSTTWDFILHHQRTISQECTHILGHTADAEDAATEVMLRLYRFLNESPDASKRITYPKAWVRQVSRNYSIDYYRQRSRYQMLVYNTDDLNQFEHNNCPEKKNRLTQAVNMISDAIADLPGNLRDAILMRCIDGASYAQLSDQFDITEANARKRVQLARKRIKQRVSDVVINGVP
ncbi:MAG: RNA polymerase sigma factor [Marinobacterium sp.]|nr:RNA polymerase sigma factor [Marinobacterium sp.]